MDAYVGMRLRAFRCRARSRRAGACRTLAGLLLAVVLGGCGVPVTAPTTTPLAARAALPASPTATVVSTRTAVSAPTATAIVPVPVLTPTLPVAPTAPIGGPPPRPLSSHTIGPLADSHTHHTSTALRDGRVLIVGGGGNAPDNPHPAELYDPLAKQFARGAALLAAPARVGHTATLLADGRVLVAGGADGDACLADAELYDPATGAWSATGPLAAARADHTATLLASGLVLVAGGSTARCAAPQAELYDPATGRWRAAGALATGRAEHTATLLADGRVLVAGGYDVGQGGRAVAAAELYDPADGRWRAAAPLATARAGHTATALPDGRVLAVGGYGALLPTGRIADPLAAVERYDPVADRWETLAPLGGPRLDHTATPFPGGYVLVAGGNANNRPTLELYNPLTGTWQVIGDLIDLRARHTTDLLVTGQLLLVGGTSSGTMGELVEVGH